MALFDGAASPTLIPVHGTDQVADVTGAGDTVIAACGLALACGASFEEAAVIANVAAGLVGDEVGTVAVALEKLKLAVVTAKRRAMSGEQR